MRAGYSKSFYFLLYWVGSAGMALAEWRVVPAAGEDGFISSDPAAISVGSTGIHTLGLTCLDGYPNIFTYGYPASGGSFAETIQIAVDGQSFSMEVVHQRPDGLWIGNATAEIVNALRSGTLADVSVPGDVAIRYSLRGSSRGIDLAIGSCVSALQSDGPVAPQAEAAVAPPGSWLPPRFGQDLQQACNGAFEVDHASIQQDDLDGDGIPDAVLDMAGVFCDDPLLGRGAGMCGISMCSIWVLTSSNGEIQDILGIAPRIVSRAFGETALEIIRLRPACPDGQLDCRSLWRWTGAELKDVL